MMKLALGLACLLIAALLAAVGYVLARPRWRWDPPVKPCPTCGSRSCEWWVGPPFLETHPPTVDEVARLELWKRELARPPSSWKFTTGSPPSVTTRADNGTAWSAVISSPDDAARWAGG